MSNAKALHAKAKKHDFPATLYVKREGDSSSQYGKADAEDSWLLADDQLNSLVDTKDGEVKIAIYRLDYVGKARATTVVEVEDD